MAFLQHSPGPTRPTLLFSPSSSLFVSQVRLSHLLKAPFPRNRNKNTISRFGSKVLKQVSFIQHTSSRAQQKEQPRHANRGHPEADSPLPPGPVCPGALPCQSCRSATWVVHPHPAACEASQARGSDPAPQLPRKARPSSFPVKGPQPLPCSQGL